MSLTGTTRPIPTQLATSQPINMSYRGDIPTQQSQFIGGLLGAIPGIVGGVRNVWGAITGGGRNGGGAAAPGTGLVAGGIPGVPQLPGVPGPRNGGGIRFGSGVSVGGYGVGVQGGMFGPGSTAPTAQLGLEYASCPPKGYRWNKTGYFTRDGQFHPPGTRIVKIRRRNPLNPRALSRSISRIKGAKRAASSLSQITVRKKSC